MEDHSPWGNSNHHGQNHGRLTTQRAWSISCCEFLRAWAPIRRSPNQLTFMFSERYVCYSNLQAGQGEETQRTPTPPQSSSYCRHCYSCYVLNSSIAGAERPALQWMACAHTDFLLHGKDLVFFLHFLSPLAEDKWESRGKISHSPSFSPSSPSGRKKTWA
jgi:hypothetical protein